MNKNAWQIRKIGDICNLMTGGTPNRSKPEYFNGGKIRWLVSGDIHKKEIYDCGGRITELGMKSSNTKYLPVNSVMIALNGQGKTRGTVALLRVEATCNQSLVSIFPKNKDSILPEYIYCNLMGRYEEIRKITSDDNNDRRGLNMNLIRNIEIPVPSLDEQKKIIILLNKVTGEIEKAKKNTEKNLQNSKELFESYLQGTFIKTKDWENCLLNDHVKFIDYRGRTPKKTNSGLRLITAKNIKKGFLQRKPEEFISPDDYYTWMTRGLPKKGDVLFTTEAPLANVAQLDTDEKVAFAQRTIIFQPDQKKINQTFLKYLLLSKPMQDKILEKGTGATVKGIKSSLLKKIPIAFPSLEKQEIIVSKLNSLSSETQKLESIYSQKLSLLEELKKSVLHKAFCGEL